jgi:Mrp family chromosome partitioning ATPase
MSKILQAMRKVAPKSKGDFSYQLETYDGVRLFPPPSPQHLAEFEQLANALIGFHDGTSGQVITFASSTKGEGNSFVSYNVARHLSFMLDRKVAWIDANFRSPQDKILSVNVSFRNLLQEPESFARVRMGGNLVLIPNGDTKIKPTDLLNSQNYLALLEQFRRNFYFTILDSPPILDSVDVAHLAGPTMGLVIVVEARRLKHEVIQHGLANVRSQNVNVLGTVLNKRAFAIPSFLYKKI